MLLEDVQSDAELIVKELSAADIEFEHLHVSNRSDFESALKGFRPNVVISDFFLPDINGLEALKLSKRVYPHIPFIIVTGSINEETAVECMRLGASDYVLKERLERLPMSINTAVEAMRAFEAKEKAETALREREASFRLLAENMSDLVCLHDLSGCYVYVSPSSYKLLGYKPEELIGLSPYDFFHPDDIPKVRAESHDIALRGEVPNPIACRIRRKNDDYIWIETLVQVIKSDNGEVIGLQTASRDITDRKQAEAKIERLAAFASQNPNPVFEFSKDGDLTYFNFAAKRIAELVDCSDPSGVLPENVKSIVLSSLKSEKEMRNIKSIIGDRTISLSFFPIPKSRVVHCYAEDITERLNMEVHLREAQKMETVGQLAAGIAHDFNNILTIIQGHASLIQETPGLNELTVESAKNIRIASERAAYLTKQLLAFGRKQIVRIRPVDLNALISNSLQRFRDLLGKSIELKFEPAECHFRVQGDAELLNQVLINLVLNARDAMLPGGGKLTVAVYPLASEPVADTSEEIGEGRDNLSGRYTCIEVRDTGCGIERRNLTRIFEPFFTTKDVGKGSGLGLSMVYGIVKQHRGWVDVETEAGVGTAMKIYIPCYADDEGAITEIEGVTPEEVDFKKTILVVEDDIAVQRLLSTLLKSKGFNVLVASTAAEAFSISEEYENSIDLLLTDIVLPDDMTGRDVADKIIIDRPEIKILYSSGYSPEWLGMGFGGQSSGNFISKPFMPSELMDAINAKLTSE
ncbi:MAG: response regulator [Verrucomicrobia bacterium]|nr:response regulator [Verrucomicrobiota bacterium]